MHLYCHLSAIHGAKCCLTVGADLLGINAVDTVTVLKEGGERGLIKRVASETSMKRQHPAQGMGKVRRCLPSADAHHGSTAKILAKHGQRTPEPWSEV